MFTTALILINALENRLSDYPTFQKTIIISSCSAMFRILIIFFCGLFYDAVNIQTTECWMVGWWMGKVLEGQDQGLSMALSWNLSGGTGKPQETCHDSLCPSQDSNQVTTSWIQV